MTAGLVVVDERKLRFEIEADALRARSAMAGDHSGEELGDLDTNFLCTRVLQSQILSTGTE